MKKVLTAFSEQQYNEMITITKERGITIQELLRAVIIPEWLAKERERKSKEATTHVL